MQDISGIHIKVFELENKLEKMETDIAALKVAHNSIALSVAAILKAINIPYDMYSADNLEESNGD